MGTLPNEPLQTLRFSASMIAHFGLPKKLSTHVFQVSNPQIWGLDYFYCLLFDDALHVFFTLPGYTITREDKV